MATFNKFNAFKEAIAEKIHNLGSDQIVVALTNTAPTSADAVLADISEISYAHCSTRDVSTVSSGLSGSQYQLVLTDLTLTASGGSVGPFRYIVLYNDTAVSDNLIGWYDYGSSITLSDGETLDIDFAATTITID